MKERKTILYEKCKSLGLKCTTKMTKNELEQLLDSINPSNINNTSNTSIKFEIIDDDNNPNQNTNLYKMIDLFAGTGAFSYAFHKTNKFETILANDLLDSSEEIYKLNQLGTNFIKQDLLNIDINNIPSHYILTGGFPCQPFSIAGQQKGFEDDRANVFWKILDILKSCQTQIVVLENVKNLQSHDNGNTFKIIKEELEKLNYYVKYTILNTSKITRVPQGRERIYIVCFKDINLYNSFYFDFDEIDCHPIENYLEKNVNDKYYYKETSQIYKELKENIHKHINTNTVYQYRRYYVRENKTSVCPTLTANMGSGGHNVPLILDDKGIRKLTPRECFNLQGFPIDYKLPSLSDAKLYSLAGNAVSVPVVQLIADKIAKLIS
jgi:DNA (cytosine-5)-methyltransferase 1